MNTKTLANTKSNRLYAVLKEKIEDGSFAAGMQLPSCRRLAEEYDVSYVTAAQALKSLVGEGLARNLRGRGIFIPDAAEEQPTQRQVKLICMGAESPMVMSFLFDGAQILGEAGWEVRQILTSKVELVDEELEDYDSFFILFGFNFSGYRRIIQTVERLRAQRRVVVLGERCERYGIASIIADEPQLMRCCMQMLEEHGHRHVGLLCGNIGNSVEQERFSTWRRYYAEDSEWPRLFFDMNITSEDGDEGEFARKYWQRQLQQGAFSGLDALICPDAKLAAITLGFLLDHGFKVPDDISLVSIGDADYLRMVRPQITAVEPGFTEHLNIALQLLEERVRGLNQLPLLHLCEPTLTLRGSVKKRIPAVKY